MAAAAATKGDMTPTNVALTRSVGVDKIREAGAEIETGPDWLDPCNEHMRPKSVVVSITQAAPRLPPPICRPRIMALDCVADGTAQITRTIFENRFMRIA